MLMGAVKIVFGIILCSLVFSSGLTLLTGLIFLAGLIGIIGGLTAILNWVNDLKEQLLMPGAQNITEKAHKL